jgi:hypothetical protein
MTASPVTLLGARLRAGVYTLGTYIQPPPLPRVSVLEPFAEVTRSVSFVTTAVVRLVRTPPFADQCSVQWNVIGTGPTPITGGYFFPIGLPFGLGTFQPGNQYLDITLSFSSGPLPPSDLFGIFQVFGASGCTILASRSSFQFRLLEVPPFASPWVWDEPAWIPVVSYASAPNKLEITSAAGLAALATATAGNTYVINGDIDGAGANYIITAAGTQANPVRIMANGSVGNATIRNCTLTIDSSNYLLVHGINFNNVTIYLNGAGSFIQLQANEFTNVLTNADDGAVRIDRCTYRYIRVYGNEFGNLHGVPYNAGGVTTNVIIPKKYNTNHWKYLWIERNLFKNFSPQRPRHRNQSVFIGEANPDSDKNTFTTFKDNLILDSADAAVWEMKLAGNMRILGNTVERGSTAVPAVVAKIRFGSIKERDGPYDTGVLVRAVGALIEGNLLVTPAGSDFSCGGFRIKDAGHRIIHNWGVRLAPGEQPNLNSPLNGSTIGLGFGNMDLTWWPETVVDIEREDRTGRYYINTGYNTVAGNRMTVEVGSEENPLHEGEPLWPATTNTVSAATPLRTDRNAAVTLYPEPRQLDTTTEAVVLDVDYNRVPVRILASTCGRNAP